MHHIHHTEGIILGSRNYGEDGKYFYIFTKELGLVTASASGVRKISSRLRFILQDYAYLKVDLVRGKDFWRVTSASRTDFLSEFPKNLPAVKVFTNITRLLKRLLPGEDPNTGLFKDVVAGMAELGRVQKKEEIQSIEIGVVLKILQHLGYVGAQQVNDLLTQRRRGEILAFINKTLNETHL